MNDILHWVQRHRQRTTARSNNSGITRRQRHEAGQVMVLVAVTVTVLLLVAGLGVDVGYLRYQKEQMQKAADAAAVAGAIALNYNGAVTTAARADAAANGFPDDNAGIAVAVNNPPLSGAFTGNSNYVEVIVSQPRPTFFMRVGGFSSVNVRARAVGSAAQKASGCIYVLDPTDSASLLVDGNVTIDSTCGILVNSGSATALVKNGVSGSVTASFIGVVGGYSGTGFTPTPTEGIAHFGDPLAGIPTPTPASGCMSGPIGGTFNPGTYCNGITIHGNGSYTFFPGLYTIEGAFTVTGSPTLTGNGVTFFLTKNSSGDYYGVNIGGGASQSFSAPTDASKGGIPGVLFFQDRSLPVGSASSSFGGGVGTGYTGALYFPTTFVKYAGNPSLQALQTIFVAWELEFAGDTYISNYTQLAGGGGPIHSTALVE